MGTQQIISNFSKLGCWLEIIVDDQGLITAGLFTKPQVPSGLSLSVLDPANEIGTNLDDVLNALLKRLNQHIAMESKK